MSAGGWTEIMRRDLSINDNVNFKQELSKYIVGFGNLKTNHFLGKSNLKNFSIISYM